MDFVNDLKPQSPKKKQFASAVDRLPDEAVIGAAKEPSTRKGLEPGWKRHTIVVHDDWIDFVSRMTGELSITNMDAWRYLLRLGMRNYQDGARLELEKRPRALNKLVE